MTGWIPLDPEGIITRTVTLADWCSVELVGRETAYTLIRTGVLAAHKKNPTSRRSPYLVTPRAHRAYRARITTA